MTSLGTPKESQKSKKCGKRPSQNQPQKNFKKTPQNSKEIAEGYPKVAQRNPPLPPTPAEPPRRTPSAESPLKLWSLC